MAHQLVAVINFGGPHAQVAARKVREFGIFCEVFPASFSADKLSEKSPAGVLFTGGKGNVCDEKNEKFGGYSASKTMCVGTGTSLTYEEMDTPEGKEKLKKFLIGECGCVSDWTIKDFVESSTKEIRETVKDGKVLLGLSGGVDSSVVAALLDKAIGSQLTCLFVDTGLMRKNEGDEVQEAFSGKSMNFVRVNAEARFLFKLAGVNDPEKKRKIIGEEFIRVFEEEAKKIGAVDFLAQGTIYPDIIESGWNDGHVVKSHHNVGGLPEHIDFKELVEPLKLLFKNEVRELGKELGLPEYLYKRQPFPGPGLAVRCIGEITKERLDTLREADYIFREEIANAKLDTEISQYFAIITPMKSVGVRDEKRTYEYTVALRAVLTDDFMTAKCADIPYDVLQKVSKRIVGEVPSVNRIVYDITAKPPATIEWE